MYRYLVVKDAELANDVKILMRSNDKESVERLVQRHEPEDIKVYELKYTAENVLCKVEYDGESSNLDTLSDVTRPAADYKVGVGGSATPKKWNNVISYPDAYNGATTIDT